MQCVDLSFLISNYFSYRTKNVFVIETRLPYSAATATIPLIQVGVTQTHMHHPAGLSIGNRLIQSILQRRRQHLLDCCRIILT